VLKAYPDPSICTGKRYGVSIFYFNPQMNCNDPPDDNPPHLISTHFSEKTTRQLCCRTCGHRCLDDESAYLHVLQAHSGATPSNPLSSNYEDDLSASPSSNNSFWIHPEVIAGASSGVLIEDTDVEEGTIVAVSSLNSSDTGVPRVDDLSSEVEDTLAILMRTSSPMPNLPFVLGSSPRAPENNWNHSTLRSRE
jgi:hypothetical protein